MNVFIQGDQQGGFSWQVNSEEAVHIEKHQGTLEELADFYRLKQAAPKVSFIYLLNAVDCAARRVFFSEKERKHIQKAIPYLLEESMLSDVEQLHIVSAKAEAGHVDVIAVDESKLESLLEPFDQAGINLDMCLPEYTLLSDSNENDVWQFIYSQGIFILSDGNGNHSAIEKDHMALALELMTEGFSHFPQRVIIKVDESLEDEARAAIAEPLQHLLKFESQPVAEILQEKIDRAKIWNFLVGPFAKTIHWQAMLKPWRWVLMALVTVFVVQTALMMIESSQYKKKNLQVRSQMDQLIREVIPQGNIVDHRKQLERKLKALKAGGGNVSFLAELETVGAVLDTASVKEINSLNYESNSQMIRLDFLVDNYDALQKIISELKAVGFNAEIQNSNAQGEQLRARLKVTAGTS